MDELASTLPEYDTVKSMEGCGNKLTSRIIAEIGDIRRFKNAGSIIAYGGLDAPPYQSGQFEATIRHISKRGNKYLRKTGYEIVKCIKSNKKVGEDISYITGAKTGYIRLAGNCLASTARIDNVNYLLVTLNAYSNKKSPHILDAISTYKYFSNNYSYKYILTKNDVVVNLKTKYAKEKNIDIHSSQEYKYYLKN